MAQLFLSNPTGGMDAQRLSSYLYQLTEQLRYVLNNLGQENLDAALAQQVQEGVQAAQLSRKVSDALGNYSTVKQTAQAISVTASALDGRITQVEATASGLSSRVEDAEGDLSSLQQTASGLSSQVTNAQGTASAALQTAGGLSTRISNAEGDITRIQQTIQGLSVTNRIADGSYSAMLSGNYLYFLLNGQSRGYLCFEDSSFDVSAPGRMLRLYSAGGGLQLDAGEVKAPGGSSSYGDRVLVSGSLIPDGNGAYQMGGYNQRWKYIFCAESSIRTGSDRALKRDIAPADSTALLKGLRPKRYVMKADALGKLRFGFIAQEVRDLIAGTQYEDAALFDEGDGGQGNLGLLYCELIAPLVEGWQAHQARIEQLEARVARLEAMEASAGGAQNARMIGGSGK